jgi:hypothetical protein
LAFCSDALQERQPARRLIRQPKLNTADSTIWVGSYGLAGPPWVVFPD